MMADAVEALSELPSCLQVQPVPIELRLKGAFATDAYLLAKQGVMESWLGPIDDDEVKLDRGRFRCFVREMQPYRIVLPSRRRNFEIALNWIDEFVRFRWSYHQDWDIAVFSFENVSNAVQFNLTHGIDLCLTK